VSARGTVRALARLAPAPRTRVALAALLGALTTLFGVGLMATAGYLICRAAERPAVLSLMVTIVAVRFFGLGRPLVRYGERLASHDVALRALGRARARVYAHLLPLAPAQLGPYREGDLLSRLVADVDGLQNLYLRVILPPVVAVLAAAVAVGATAAFLPSAALILASGLLVGAVAVPALSGTIGRDAGHRQAAARGTLAAEFVELVRGAPELVAYGVHEQRLGRLVDADTGLVGMARRDAVAAGLGDGLELIVSGVTVAGVLLAAVLAADRGALDEVLIAMLSLLTLSSFESVTPLVATVRDLATTLGAGRRILAVTGTTPLVDDPVAPLAPPLWPFSIELRAVTARYPNQPVPALEGFSLRLDAGERVALLGPSGAGKTTVVNLLLRFLDPCEGHVLLGPHDLRRYRQQDVRAGIALAGQESHLFSTTIASNLRLARPAATDAELETALRRARIWEWVARLPEGLETQVGEEGRELSGGQRQRLVIARAMLQDAPVLILDEPTAHLDPGTAAELMHDILGQTRGRTVLLITHRSEGVGLVDRVVVAPSAARRDHRRELRTMGETDSSGSEPGGR
jgi:thiol reductant ABC exporter CydC subunit